MVDRDAVARVLDRYGLRPIGRMSARNGVVRIATTGGPKALTRYPAERPTRSIASEHSIPRQLEALANERPPGSNAPLARDWRWLPGQAPRIVEPLAQLSAELATMPLSRTVVHGDFGVRSVRFRDPSDPVLVGLGMAHGGSDRGGRAAVRDQLGVASRSRRIIFAHPASTLVKVSPGTVRPIMVAHPSLGCLGAPAADPGLCRDRPRVVALVDPSGFIRDPAGDR